MLKNPQAITLKEYFASTLSEKQYPVTHFLESNLTEVTSSIVPSLNSLRVFPEV